MLGNRKRGGSEEKLIKPCLKPTAVGIFPRGKGGMTPGHRDLVSNPEGKNIDLAMLMESQGELPRVGEEGIRDSL